ncbi:hypothetical protein [Paenibacillus polymyxa]|uniref:Uncharacterized protein n=1 Tax=Paenibacillus polymyxa (strain SC2) TaxID=886882 RepID=E3EKK5_PAEPS|nr:hypothetical protein [Paenibacillus polymyxa]ADO59837.1 hypothetical protein PPSC2_25985 [Paenibacillus polymyxa SC2]WPQ59931.1 hypothetical protein SKN87_27195 [Paenibacillus polymyxa]
MRLVPLKQWYCDHCGKVIERPEDGYLEWKKKGNDTSYGFRIVHFKTCQYNENALNPNEILQDLQLDEFVGSDGLVRLLWLLRELKFRNVDEMYEIFQRIQLPNYEEARTHFNEAVDDGYIEMIGARENSFSHNLLTIIEKYAQK